MQQKQLSFNPLRLDVWYGLILLVFAIFIIKLFYVQIIKHDDYQQAALSGQLKQYEIPANRGIIKAHDGDSLVPIVLNEDTYTLFADPKFIKEPGNIAEKLVAVTEGDKSGYEQKMRAGNRYEVLAKRLTKEQKEKIEKLELVGVGLRTEPIRTYPQGSLAAQILGFVNDEGKGAYGVEQYLDNSLAGQPGQLKAITDVRGVPLASSSDNVRQDAVNGRETTLTIDIGMQRKTEEILKAHLEQVRSKSGSIIIIDPNSGAIKAMANYPGYNPAEFNKVTDQALFTNPALSDPMEVGSIMKTLTMAAGLNENVINPNTTYGDSGSIKIDGSTISNVEGYSSPATRSMTDILKFSLNTGASFILRQLGGGEFNEKGRKVWHDYMVNHYQLGKMIGIEQGYEAAGSIPNPTDGYALNLQYANTSFGQGTNITLLQMAGAFSSVINGGIYYKPHLVDPEAGTAPVIVRADVVRPEVSAQLRSMMETVATTNYRYSVRDGYSVGGKTGTAQITKPGGGYYEDRYNGTFIGYVGGDRPEYVIVLRVNEPHINGFAGSQAAAPLFGKTTNMLLDNFLIKPKSR